MKPRLTPSSAASTAMLTFFLISAGLAHAGVYDDAAAWWHFDYDPDTDGLADLDEIRDQRDWGTAASKGTSGKHATTVRGFLGAPQWTNAPVVCPAGGEPFGTRSIYFQTAIDPVSLTNCYPDTFLVSNLQLPGSATLLTRFRWDGYPTQIEKTSWLFNNALEWNKYWGWLFGVSSNTYPRLTLYTQRGTVQMDVPMTNGVWYDAAMVLTDGGLTNPTDSVEFYLWRENGTLAYRKYTTTVVTNAIGTQPAIIGCEASPTAYAAGNARKAFIGAVNHMAVWKRALSFAEINEAFGHPQPFFSIGLNNASDTDLRIESEAGAEYAPGDPWHTMRRAVTASNPEAKLKIPLTDVQTNLDCVFHLKTRNTGAAGQTVDLSLIVNTTTNLAKTAGQDQDLFWFIPRKTLVAGTNTFTLRYASGTSSWITFDWMEVGGAWQVGYDNGSPSEFVVESQAADDFFVTDPNWQHMERAIAQGTETNTVLHFALSPELLAKYHFTYTTRIVSQGRNTGTLPEPPYPFSIGVNGRILYHSDSGLPDGTPVKIPFARGDLRDGANEINLMFNSTNGWAQFDFHRLEIRPWPSGSMLRIQ